MRTQSQIERLDKINCDWRIIEEKQPELIDQLLETNITKYICVYLFKNEFVVMINNYDNPPFNYVGEDGFCFAVRLSDIISRLFQTSESICVDKNERYYVRASFDDSYYEYNGIEDITDEEITNPENEDGTICALVRVSTYHDDITYRQLVRDDKYSQRRSFIDDVKGEVDHFFKFFDDEYENINDFITQIKQLYEIGKNLKEKWDEIENEYNYGGFYSDMVPSYEELITEAKGEHYQYGVDWAFDMLLANK